MANIYNIATGQSSSGDLTQAMADQGWVYGSAPAQGSNNAPIVNTQTGQTAAGFTNTAQAITGQMWQPVTSQNVDFNKASNPTFLKDSSVTPESYTATGGMTRLTTLPPSQYPMDVPSKIGSDVEEVKKDLTTELKKVTQAGQRISSPSELSQYKESDLARTTDGGIYRRDLALEKSVMPEYAKQYGAPKTKEEWNKFHDFAYKVANTTGANGLPINGTISDADGSKIPTDEAGVPDASASLTWTQQLNQVMSDITASREALAEKEDELAQYQEDTALGVQDVGEQLGRSAALVTGEQGALQQRRATKELTLAKQAQTLQLKIQGLTQDRQFISQQVQQMSSNARSNLSMILNSMTGSTTKWSDIPLAQQTALRQLAEQAGVPSDILSMSIDNQAEIASTQQGGQLSISEQLALREAGLTVDDNGNVIQIQQDISNATVDDIANAIKTVESNGNYSASGASGEYGAYQFMPATWASWSKEYAGKVLGQSIGNMEMTQENQDSVAKFKIGQWLSNGLSPQQIAAKWNSGSEFDWENKVGTNSKGVEYNVPGYVNKVVGVLGNIIPTTEFLSDYELANAYVTDPDNNEMTDEQKKSKLLGEVNAGNLDLSISEINAIIAAKGSITSETFTKDWWEDKWEQADKAGQMTDFYIKKWQEAGIKSEIVIKGLGFKGLKTDDIYNQITEHYDKDELNEKAKEEGFGLAFRGARKQIKDYIDSLIQ